VDDQPDGSHVGQSSPFGGVLEMSHREEPRSGRGCFGAVVVVPFLALGGMFALIAFTGGPSEAPVAAAPPSRPSAWWAEPLETGVSLATVTETVVVGGGTREVPAARGATRTRVVGGATVTETVRVSGSKPAVAGRNEPEVEPDGEMPSGPDGEVPSASVEVPVVTTTAAASAPVVVSTVESAPPVEVPASEGPAGEVPAAEVPPSSTPRAEDPVPPVVTSPGEPVCDRAASSVGEGVGGVSPAP
jgi:hypothetical protein